MRSLNSLKIKFLGKWVTCGDWEGRRYYCVGEGENYIYIWYAGYVSLTNNVWRYGKDGMFKVVGQYKGLEREYYGYDNVETFVDLFNNDSNITWIR